jgi:hypothetical protein
MLGLINQILGRMSDMSQSTLRRGHAAPDYVRDNFFHPFDARLETIGGAAEISYSIQCFRSYACSSVADALDKFSAQCECQPQPLDRSTISGAKCRKTS